MKNYELYYLVCLRIDCVDGLTPSGHQVQKQAVRDLN